MKSHLMEAQRQIKASERSRDALAAIRPKLCAASTETKVRLKTSGGGGGGGGGKRGKKKTKLKKKKTQQKAGRK